MNWEALFSPHLRFSLSLSLSHLEGNTPLEPPPPSGVDVVHRADIQQLDPYREAGARALLLQKVPQAPGSVLPSAPPAKQQQQKNRTQGSTKDARIANGRITNRSSSPKPRNKPRGETVAEPTHGKFQAHFLSILKLHVILIPSHPIVQVCSPPATCCLA